MACGVRVAGHRVTDQNRIGGTGIESAPGFKGTADIAQAPPEFQGDVVFKRHRLDMQKRPYDAIVVGAGKPVGR